MKKEKIGFRTMRTVEGHTIHLIEEEGQLAKPHCTTGPAFIYADESVSPEYYLYGLKYEKQKWKETLHATRRVKHSENFEAL
jgi:hypothetical protein